MNDYEPKITTLSALAQKLIDNIYALSPDNEVFKQAGILSGDSIVTSYIKHGELGLAVEHLLYMVYESEIDFPHEKLVNLNTIAASLSVANGYSKKVETK